MNYKECADQIIEKVGGSENVDSVTHCATRLRFVVKNIDIVKMDDLKSIKGVYGVIYSNGQLQVVLAGNLIPVFNEVVNNYNFTVTDIVDEKIDETVDEKWTIKKVLKKGLEILTASVTPVIPAVIAGGMVKVVLIIINLVYSDFATTSTYTLLSMLADAPFYFLPFFVAYGCSKKINANLMYSMVVAGALIYPSFMSLIEAGNPVTLFGLPVALVKYSSSLFPALFATVTVKYFEKLFDKIIPGMFKVIVVGAFTIICSYAFTMIALAPLGYYIGEYLVKFLVWLNGVAGPLAVGVLAACTPFMVMTGMHLLLPPVMIQSHALLGYLTLEV